MTFTWTLPDSPDDRRYRDILAEIEVMREKRPRQALLMLRKIAEADFWFFNAYVCSFGTGGRFPQKGDHWQKHAYLIDEPGHPRLGKPWANEPFVFDLCREVQDIIVNRIHPSLIYAFRNSFKTETITKDGSLWIGARDRNETVAIFTHKVEQSGESMGGAILTELETNEILKACWPQFRTLQEKSDTRIIWDRPSGPRDPSIAILPAMGSATSGHPSFMFFDDAVTDRIIDTPGFLRTIDNQIKRAIPLRQPKTPMVFVGTPWGKDDPIDQRRTKGWFKREVIRACRKDGVAQLHTERFFREQREQIGDDFLYFSQYEMRIVPRGERYFLDEWWQTYPGKPEERAQGSHIHIILDMGGGNEDSDYTVLRVLAKSWDRKKYILDLWRERIGLNDCLDLVFGVPADEADAPGQQWKPKDGLVRWNRFDPGLTLWIEEFGAAAWYEAFVAEKRRRAKISGQPINLRIRKLPKLNRPKPTRIRKLQPVYRRGEILYPEGGFGHGTRFGYSGEPDDRDTMLQFREDEYGVWTLEYGAKRDAVDDQLDTEAWHCQEEVERLMPWPEPQSTPGRAGVLSFHRPHTPKSSEPAVSWQAY